MRSPAAGGSSWSAASPGIGKSRLAEELVARGAGARRARARRALLGGRRRARLLAVGAVAARVRARRASRSAARAGSATGAAELAQLAARAARGSSRICPSRRAARVRGRALPPLRRDRRVPPATPRSERPLVLVLDDLHAADAPSLLLLRFVARELGSSRISSSSAPSATSIPCPGDAARRAAGRGRPRAGHAALSLLGGLSAARRRCVRRADGAGHRLSRAGRGAPRRDRGQSALRRRDRAPARRRGRRPEAPARLRLAIPASVRDVIARRLAHLSDECNRAARARVGARARVRPRHARSRAGIPDERRLLDTLDEAMAARVVADVPGAPGRLRFTHVLIRDTLYEGAHDARAASALHRRALRGARGPLRRRARAAPRRARPPFDRRRRLRARASATPGWPADGRSRCSPTRRPRASTQTALDALELVGCRRRADALRAAARARRGAGPGRRDARREGDASSLAAELAGASGSRAPARPGGRGLRRAVRVGARGRRRPARAAARRGRWPRSPSERRRAAGQAARAARGRAARRARRASVVTR